VRCRRLAGGSSATQSDVGRGRQLRGGKRRGAGLPRETRHRSQHRSVPLPDLLIAACAESAGLALLHYDADFDRIAELTGQDVQWVMPQGSVS
jgi:predicted nucleic acid-binding protein